MSLELQYCETKIAQLARNAVVGVKLLGHLRELIDRFRVDVVVG